MPAKSNPYSTLISLMRDQGAKYNPPGIQLGVVLTSSPLAVETGDLQLNKGNLLIADYLLADYQRTIDINTSNASGKTDSQTVGDHGSHSHNISTIGLTGGKITYKDTLKTGDTVALIQISDVTFLIFCKVVSA